MLIAPPYFLLKHYKTVQYRTYINLHLNNSPTYVRWDVQLATSVVVEYDREEARVPVKEDLLAIWQVEPVHHSIKASACRLEQSLAVRFVFHASDVEYQSLVITGQLYNFWLLGWPNVNAIFERPIRRLSSVFAIICVIVHGR